MQGLRKVGSPRGEVGEIDTRVPFQSVKAAVSLFGEAAVSRDRFTIKRRSSENVFEKETQLILAQRELSKIKKQLETCEATKAKALADLEIARENLEKLTADLTNVRESKQTAMEAAEAVKNQGQHLEKSMSLKAIGYESWKNELEHARKEYTITISELDASKQELTKLRQDFDAALEAKLAAFQNASEAQRSATFNSEKVNELSKEIAEMKASIEQLKVASAQTQAREQEQEAQQQQQQVMKQQQLEFYKTSKEETHKRLESLRAEYDPELIQSLETKLEETSSEIEDLQEQMRKAHASEMESMAVITSALKEASKTLQDIAVEENSLKSLVFSLRMELKQVKKEQEELKRKEQAAEALTANLSVDLEVTKGGMESPMPGSENAKQAEIFYDQNVKIKKLSSETESARREAEEMRRKAQEMRQEAEKYKALAIETENKLLLALRDAKEAKAAEKRAIEEMKHVSELQARISNSKSAGKIKIKKEEFESLSGKAKECEDSAEKKVAEVVAEVQAIYSRKTEVDRKVEANQKAIEEINAATEMALWHAEMDDIAKMTSESELRRRRQKIQNEEPNVSSQMLGYPMMSSLTI